VSKRYQSILGALLCVGLIGCSPQRPAASAPEASSIGKPPKTRAIRDLPGWVTVPGGSAVFGSREAGAPPPREGVVPSFWMSRTEITTAQFARFLNDTRTPFESPQFVGAPGHLSPRDPRDPVVFVSHAQAGAYARWLSGWLRVEVSLPTEDEWEYAARGGVHAAPYPWGWAEPAGRAAFRLDGLRPVGSYPPNPYLLYDLGGNAAEWCAAAPDAPRAPVRGGSWSERSPRLLRVWNRVELPRDYRDADTGFRVIARPAAD
jgi:formylglycine-generating enzyme required for sulfatase activity